MKKIIGIFIVTLLLATALPTLGSVNQINERNTQTMDNNPVNIPDNLLEGADQYQTEHGEVSNNAAGWVVTDTYMGAQEFKPTKDTLTAVALNFGATSFNVPSGIDITVCIRESLDGDDLTSVSVNADENKFLLDWIPDGDIWAIFDFDDITVNPEQTYYLVCYSNDNDPYDSYIWYIGEGNKYERGIAWVDADDIDWTDLEYSEWWDPALVEGDFCFVSYSEEPPESETFTHNHPMLFNTIFRIIENHPSTYFLFKQIFGL